jgi:hypothetical protein
MPQILNHQDDNKVLIGKYLHRLILSPFLSKLLLKKDPFLFYYFNYYYFFVIFVQKFLNSYLNHNLYRMFLRIRMKLKSW